MTPEKERFDQLRARFNALDIIADWIKTNYSIGDELPGEGPLKLEIGYNKEMLREALICLECFGFVEIRHGKSTKVVGDIDSYKTSGDENVRFKRFCIKSEVTNKLLSTIGRNYQVGDKLIGERALETMLECGRPKVREAKRKLECFGFIKSEPQKRSIVIKRSIK
jgi:DNA-binding FadR family transcriptional regulator